MRDKSLPPFHTHRCAQMLSWGYRTSLLRGCDEPGEANLAGTGKQDSVCLLLVKRVPVKKFNSQLNWPWGRQPVSAAKEPFPLSFQIAF